MTRETTLTASRGKLVFGQGGFVLHRLEIGAASLEGGRVGRRTAEIAGYILPEGESEAARAAELERCRTLVCRIAADAAGFTLAHGGRQMRLTATGTPEFSSDAPLNGADAAYFTIRARSAEKEGSFAGAAASVSARGLDGALCFPLAISSETVFGVLSHAGEIAIRNEGDMPAGFVAEITAEGGDLTEVTLSLDADEIAVSYGLAEGRTMRIDTRTGSKDVRADGTSILAHCDWRSSFFHLPPGESRLAWRCAGTGHARMRVEFVPKFI